MIRPALAARLVALTLTGALLAPVPYARAEEGSGPTYELDLRYDLPAILVPGALAFGWVLHDEYEPAHCAPLCDDSDLNAIDRGAAGNYDEGWSTASDLVLLGAGLGGMTALVVEEGWSDALNDVVVIAESVLWTNAVAIVGNLAARRPRPLLYGEDAPLEEREDPRAALSFISGHVGVVAALTTSLYSTFDRRDPDGTLQYWTLGAGALATGAVALGRVQSGDHFPTDVILGAAVGACMGLLVPALHDSPVTLVPVAGSDGAGVLASIAW